MLFSPIIISKTVKVKNVVNTCNMAKTIVGISLDSDLLFKIDEKRGLVPRSRYVAQILAANLGVED